MFFIKQDLPINEQIRAREVQIIDNEGNKVGPISIHEALDMAYEKKLDLVLVAPNAEVPVCKLMNYGKYKFEQAKREKEAKKKQKTFELKELNYVKQGEAGLNRFIEELSDIATPEKRPILEGKNMFIILAKK